MGEPHGLDLERWSNSALSLLQDCGEAFRRRYIEKERRPGTLRLVRGRVIHAVAHLGLHRKWKQGTLPTVPEARDLAADQFDAMIRHDGVRFDADDLAMGAAKAQGQAKDFSIGLSGHHIQAVAPSINPVGVERTIYVKPKDMDITIMGRLDLIDRRPTGEWVRDLKTSGKSPAKHAAETSQQLTMQSMLRWAEVGTMPERLALDFLVRTPTGQEKYVPLLTTRTPEDVQTLVHRLNTAIEAVRRGSFVPASPDSWKCLHPETEILTRGGWRTYAAGINTEKDEVLTLNPVTWLLEWERPAMVFAKPNAKPLVHYSGRVLAFAVTPDHTMLVRGVGSTRFHRRPASEIHRRASFSIPTAGLLWREPYKQRARPWLELSGWLCAEGHFRTDSAMIEIGQKADSLGASEIRRILAALELPHTEQRQPNGMLSFRLRQPAATMVRDYLQASKGIPEWLCEIDSHGFRFWLRAFSAGDGSFNTDGWSLSIAQADERFIDELQALCLTHRMTATKAMRPSHSPTSGRPFWSLSIMDQVVERIIGLKKHSNDQWIDETIPDHVWCVTVPNGLIVTRHAGRVAIVGNCSPRFCEYFQDCPYVRRSSRPTS